MGVATVSSLAEARQRNEREVWLSELHEIQELSLDRAKSERGAAWSHLLEAAEQAALFIDLTAAEELAYAEAA